MNAMPPELGIVFARVHGDEAPIADVARELGLTIDTARERLAAGLASFTTSVHRCLAARGLTKHDI